MSNTIKMSSRGVAVYADCMLPDLPPIDVHKAMKSKDVKVEGANIVLANSSASEVAIGDHLDWLSWLPQAAKTYDCSSDPADYVFVPVPVCPTDLPNRNGVAFPYNELVQFCPDLHQIVYKSWKGCPTYSEHKNDNPLLARGMVIDSTLRPVKGYGANKLYKVMALAGFDRSKFPDVAQRILSREGNAYSMGAYVREYTCSVCGHKLMYDEKTRALSRCEHTNPRNKLDFQLKNGVLAFRNCHGISPFELSEVATPAWGLATSDVIYNLKNPQASTQTFEEGTK